MKKPFLAALALAVAAGVLLPADGQARGRHGGDGWGHGQFGAGPCGERDKPLTDAQVKDIVEGKVAMMGLDATVRVEEKTPGTVLAEVVSPSGEVLRRMQVDTKTGRFQPVAQ